MSLIKGTNRDQADKETQGRVLSAGLPYFLCVGPGWVTPLVHECFRQPESSPELPCSWMSLGIHYVGMIDRVSGLMFEVNLRQPPFHSSRNGRTQFKAQPSNHVVCLSNVTSPHPEPPPEHKLREGLRGSGETMTLPFLRKSQGFRVSFPETRTKANHILYYATPVLWWQADWWTDNMLVLLRRCILHKLGSPATKGSFTFDMTREGLPASSVYILENWRSLIKDEFSFSLYIHIVITPCHTYILMKCKLILQSFGNI